MRIHHRIIFAAVLTLPLFSTSSLAALDWESALAGEHRDPRNVERDRFRHPRETLEFFGLREDMTVVELYPGGGWYTEVLAPLLAQKGQYYAAHVSPNGGAYARRSLGRYLQKLAADDDVYGGVIVTTLAPPSSIVIAPLESADMVLAFRNVHSWINAGVLAEVFSAAYAALKPGGVFGVVQHRSPGPRSEEAIKATGYVPEEFVVAAARSVGFELDGRSEVNANPRDTAQWEGGVWELPPSLDVDDADREARLAIGESDRMTLKFVKPAR